MVRATGYVLSVAANRTAPDLEPWTLLPHRTQALRRWLACRRERLDLALATRSTREALGTLLTLCVATTYPQAVKYLGKLPTKMAEI
jgi:hypothetical protein